MAESKEQLLVKGVNKDEYIRLFFYCNQPVKFIPTLEKNVLKVKFDKSFSPNFDRLKNDLGAELSDASLSADGKTAIFKLKNSNFNYRKFIGEKFVGVDLVKIAGEAKVAENKTVAQEVIKKPEVVKQQAKAVAAPAKKIALLPNVKISQAPKPVVLKKKFEKTSLSDVEVGAEIAKENKVEVAPKIDKPNPPEAAAPAAAIDSVASPVTVEVKKPELATGTKSEGDVKAEVGDALNPSQVEVKKPEATDKTPETKLPEIKPTVDKNAAEQAPKEPKVSMDAKKSSVKSKIVFPWGEDKVAASVFVRGDYLWVVFDKFKLIDVAKIVSNNKNIFGPSEQIDNPSYTILHFKLLDKSNFVVYKDGGDWVVGYTESKLLPDVEPSLSVSATELQGSKVMLRSDDTLRPLRLIDPVVEDEMIVLPYSQEGVGFINARAYTDFVFLKTAQGAVVSLISDNVNLDVVAKGAEVAGPTNKLEGSAQSTLRELQEEEKEAKLRTEKLKQSGEITLVKFNTWLMGGEGTYEKDLESLNWKITEVNWSDKNEPRLNLARFYLAHGLYAEAIGVIAILKEADPVFGATNNVKIVEATSLYLSGKYSDAVAVYDQIHLKELDDVGQQEIKFWRVAANLQLADQIKIDTFITNNAVDEKTASDGIEVGNEAENTKLMLDTSSRLLKIIRKMDPEFVNSDEIQKLESTARFVTNHYQEAIKRFGESELYKQGGDAFATADDKLWWSTSTSQKSDKADLPFLESIDVFLKYYPAKIYNDFALLALENRLKKNDLVVSEEIIGTFKTEDRAQQKNSIEFLKGLFYAKDEEDDKAIETWKPVTSDVADPYNRARSQFALTTFQLKKKEIDVKTAIEQLNPLRVLWRGGILEFQILNVLGQFYMDEKQYMDGFKVWRSAISAFPGSDESLLIAKKMSDKFAQVFNQGEADNIPKLEALTLYYEFRELTPIGKTGDDMISKLADRLIEVDLLDRAAALLTHQVRFRLIGEEKDQATLKLVKVHLMNHHSQDAYDVLNATYRENISPEILQERKYLESMALIDLGQSNKVLSLLKGDYSYQASFLRADVYWRNKVWKKVVDELETPFRELRREEKVLTADESDQLLRLAVAYALTDKKKRLQILYEDFVDFVPNPEKKKVFTFVATDKGPVDYKNLEYTVEFNDMKDFLGKYMVPGSEKVADGSGV
jgi:hypothetical protein